MKDLWDKFWEKRNRPLTNKEALAFRLNFELIHLLILIRRMLRNTIKHDTSEQISLEIGCGRATISNYLRDVGYTTWTMDRISRVENTHRFFYGDALERWHIDIKFNVIVSYGLLEHFGDDDQMRIINNCDKYLAPGGVQIHYVVPRKFTNIREDGNVFRSDCNMIINIWHPIWVYPIFYNRMINWTTNKFMAKGFVIIMEKNDENIRIGNSKVTIH